MGKQLPPLSSSSSLPAAARLSGLPIRANAAGIVAILCLTVACILVVECRPAILIKHKSVVSRDELLALPSETHYTTSSDLEQFQHNQQQQPQQRYPSEIQSPVEYVLQYSPTPSPQEVTVAYEQPKQPQFDDYKPQGQVENAVEYLQQQLPQQQQVIYIHHGAEAAPDTNSPAQQDVYIYRPDEQLVRETPAEVPNPGQEGSTSQQQAGYEYTTLPAPVAQAQQVVEPVEAYQQQQMQQQYAAPKGPASREYPGEILYFGNPHQLQDEKRPSGEMQETGSQYYNNGNNSGQLSNFADMLYKNSGLPATILTEVPVKDMPKDVLDKLRREYGVKVVATRERPGANLVINCDENSGLENTICSKSTTPSTLELSARYNPMLSFPYESAHNENGAALEEPAIEQSHHPINEVNNAEHHEYSGAAPPAKESSPATETHYELAPQTESQYMNNKQRENHVSGEHNDEAHFEGRHENHRSRNYEDNHKRREGNYHVMHHHNPQVNQNVSRHANRHTILQSEHFDIEAFTGYDQESVTSPEEAHARLQNDRETINLEPRENMSEEQPGGEEQAGFDIQTPNPSEEFKPSEENENQH